MFTGLHSAFPLGALANRAREVFPLACTAVIGVELLHRRMLRANAMKTSATLMTDLAARPVFTPHARAQ